MTADGAKTCAKVVANNAEDGVTWVHSYLCEDRCKTFCIYDGPSVDAVHAAARRSSVGRGHPAPVTVLDPSPLPQLSDPAPRRGTRPVPAAASGWE